MRIRMLALAGVAALALSSSAATQTVPSGGETALSLFTNDEVRALLLSRQPNLSRAERSELRSLDPDLWRQWLEQDQERREQDNRI